MKKFLLMAFFLTAIPTVHANISGQPIPDGPCPPFSVNMYDSAGSCATNYVADSTGEFMLGTWAHFYPYPRNTYIGLWNVFVPRAGNYMMRTHICSVSSPNEECTIAKQVKYIDTHYIAVRPDKSLSDQNANFGGGTGRYDTLTPTKFCFSLVDQSGHEFASDDATSCSDATPLPDHPNNCTLSDVDLNVNIDVKRTELTTVATAGKGIRKQLSLICTGDKASTRTVSLTSASTMPVSNTTAIGTSTPGLGISVFYNNTLLSPDTNLTEEFQPGATPITLEFVPVRDPSVPAKKIATGNYSADAVLVMTEQ